MYDGRLGLRRWCYYRMQWSSKRLKHVFVPTYGHPKTIPYWKTDYRHVLCWSKPNLFVFLWQVREGTFIHISKIYMFIYLITFLKILVTQVMWTHMELLHLNVMELPIMESNTTMLAWQTSLAWPKSPSCHQVRYFKASLTMTVLEYHLWQGLFPKYSKASRGDNLQATDLHSDFEVGKID